MRLDFILVFFGVFFYLKGIVIEGDDIYLLGVFKGVLYCLIKNFDVVDLFRLMLVIFELYFLFECFKFDCFECFNEFVVL